MYLDDTGSIYGCFRCGEIQGEVESITESGRGVCGNCGEPAVISFVNALDIINDQFLSGDLSFEGDEDIGVDIND